MSSVVQPLTPPFSGSPLAVTATAEWRAAHPGGIIGVLEVTDVRTPASSPELDRCKRDVERMLGEKYAGRSRAELVELPVMADYVRYYKRFDKTYHVQLQLESIVNKGKGFPNVNPLVDANFLAELDTLILTAGHDVEKLQQPITIDVSREGDAMTQMNGATKPIRSGDMVMRDGGGISCTIIYGQDNRSPISATTSHALYVAYAPGPVPLAAVSAQLRKIAEYIHVFAQHAVVVQETVIRA